MVEFTNHVVSSAICESSSPLERAWKFSNVLQILHLIRICWASEHCQEPVATSKKIYYWSLAMKSFSSLHRYIAGTKNYVAKVILAKGVKCQNATNIWDINSRPCYHLQNLCVPRIWIRFQISFSHRARISAFSNLLLSGATLRWTSLSGYVRYVLGFSNIRWGWLACLLRTNGCVWPLQYENHKCVCGA